MRIDADDRIFERVEGELAIRYSTQGDEREFYTTTKNISGSGIRMSLLRKLSPGTVLDLEIFRDDRNIKARCKGRVIWVWDEPMNKGSGQLFEAGI